MVHMLMKLPMRNLHLEIVHHQPDVTSACDLDAADDCVHDIIHSYDTPWPFAPSPILIRTISNTPDTTNIGIT